MKYIILLLFSFPLYSQHTLDDGDEIAFNIDKEFYALHKIDPQGVIQLFLGSCGLTTCEVDTNESFYIRYKIKDAASCWGTDGTSGWQTNLPIGNGTGDFIKHIPGITQNTTFTINCQKSANLKYKNLEIFNQIDLSLLIDDMGFDDYYSVIISLVGTEIKVLPFNEFSELKTFTPSERYDDSTRFVFLVSNSLFGSYDDFVSKTLDVESECLSYGNSIGSVPQIQLSNQQSPGTCVFGKRDSFYLAYAVYNINAK
jgi:hypothetical protein